MLQQYPCTGSGWAFKEDSGWEAVTGQGNDSALRIIAAEWRMPEGDRRMVKLGFECGSLTIECMDKESPRYHVKFFYTVGKFV